MNLPAEATTSHPSPFIRACREHDLPTVVRLLEEGEEVDQRVRPQGDTALMEACRSGREKLAKLLLEWGAQVNACNDLGETPLSLGLSPTLGEYLRALIAIAAVRPAQIQLAEEVGRGFFGVVHKCTYLGSPHAVKLPKQHSMLHFSLIYPSISTPDPPGPVSVEDMYYGSAGYPDRAKRHSTESAVSYSSPEERAGEFVDGEDKEEGVVVRRRQQRVYAEFLHEARICARVGSMAHVMPFRGAHLSFSLCMLLFDYMPQTDFLRHLKRSAVTGPALASMLTQAASGVWGLHEARVIHRDIAARNFCVGQQGEEGHWAPVEDLKLRYAG
eukprot:g21818.t1